MIRRWLAGTAAVLGCVLAMGCDDPSPTKGTNTTKLSDLTSKMDNATNKVKDTADKMKEDADKLAQEGKESVLKPITELFPKIEEKIKALTGDKAKDATTKFDELKKLVEEFKGAAPDKIADVKGKLTKLFEELKKLLDL